MISLTLANKKRQIPQGILEMNAQRLLRHCKQSCVEVQRPIDQFAEEEIIVPTGPYEGYGFKIDRQPFARLYFEEIKKACWREIAGTGPSQSGKTLLLFCIPIIWHVFELRENIIIMTPNEDIALEKWTRDLYPTISKTRYRKYLPRQGAGARGGFGDLMQFSNGASIKWMTAGGNDQTRAHYTARVVFATEVDGMATVASTSHETDKVGQVEARTNAYGRRRLIYKECTVTVPEGHIWQCYTKGTNSKICTPCPHCGQYVMAGRENLRGWQECETDVDAMEQARFFCPECGEAWSEDERRAANLNAVLVHEGQSIVDGKIDGEPKKTLTLGFRWTAANNLLVDAGAVAVEEWKAARAVDRDVAERKMCQQYWADPYKDPHVQITQLDPRKVQRRQSEWIKGYLPDETKWVSIGFDLGKWLCHWTGMAIFEDGRRHIFDYGHVEVATDSLGEDVALPIALKQMREFCDSGWLRSDGVVVPADEIWIDAGWQSTKVFEFIEDEKTDAGRYRPTFGRGFNQQRTLWYNRPKSTGATVQLIGDEYHISRRADRNIFQVEFNSDYGKSKLHSALMTTDDTTAQRVTLYKALPQQHISFSKHLASEKMEEKFIPKRGNVKVWVATGAANHWLDSSVLAYVAGTFCLENRKNVQPEKPAVPQVAIANEQHPDRPGINLARFPGTRRR